MSKSLFALPLLLFACSSTAPSTEVFTSAQRHLERAFAADIAPGWEHATLAGEPLPVLRDGTPALYLIAVAPAGYVAVDAVREGAPVIGWRTSGGLPDEQARRGLLSIQQDLAPEDPAVRTQGLATQACAGEDCPPPPSAQLDWVCKTAPFAPDWKQVPPSDPINPTGCWSGCGPTAWANVIAWISEQAWNGDPSWSPYKAIFREGGSTWGTPRRAPLVSDSTAAKQLMMTLHDDLSTHCRVGGGVQGDTDLTTAGDIDKYLAQVGLKDQFNVIYTGVTGQGALDIVNDSICTRHTPAVVSIYKDDVDRGSGFHIAVVTGIMSFGNRIYYLYDLGMNGQDNGWYGKTTQFWLAGAIAGNGKPPTVTYAEPGIRITRADYGSNCSGPGVFNGNATSWIADACDGKWDCDYTVQAGVIASTWYETARLGDPAPGCDKAYYVTWTCPDGHAQSITVGGEADNAQIHLHCDGQCIPRTTCTAGNQCGTQDDGCGTGEISCGTCTGGAYCENNKCIQPGTNCKADCRHQHDCANLDDPVLIKGCISALQACLTACDCVPKTCAQLGVSCGAVSDGCSGTLSCGGCGANQACTNGQCVCVPRTSCSGTCGNVADGCGGTLHCPACGCSCAGKKCGASDGCGQTCYGTCRSGFQCTDDGDGLKYCQHI